jgi:hypothetical protein
MSEVAEQFYATVEAGLPADHQELLQVTAGTGAGRELRRTLHLADRAVRQWAAQAASNGRPGHRSAYERLSLLSLEAGRAVQEAATTEQRTGLDAEGELIAQAVWGIGERLAGIDPEAPPLSYQPSLNRMAAHAAEILLTSGRVLNDPAWVVNEANEALRDLARPD